MLHPHTICGRHSWEANLCFTEASVLLHSLLWFLRARSSELYGLWNLCFNCLIAFEQQSMLHAVEDREPCTADFNSAWTLVTPMPCSVLVPWSVTLTTAAGCAAFRNEHGSEASHLTARSGINHQYKINPYSVCPKRLSHRTNKQNASKTNCNFCQN